MSPNKLNSIRQKWFQTQDIGILRNSRCILGWFERANVLLGSRDLVEQTQMSYSSGLREQARTVHRNGCEAGVQISITAGPINITPNILSSWTFHSNIQRFNPSQQYVQAVRLGRRKVAIVIDSDTKQAWLVPFLSLVLHLCHIYIGEFKLPYEVDLILFAEPSPDGSLAVIEAIEATAT